MTWGEPVGGLVVGIGRVRAFRGPDRRLVINAHLANRGDQEIAGVIQSRSRFIVELDGRFFAEDDLGGMCTCTPPGSSHGPIIIETGRFREIKGLVSVAYIDPEAPRPSLAPGPHRIRIHYKLDRTLVPSEEVVVRVPSPSGDDEDAIPHLAALVESGNYKESILALRALSQFPGEAAANAIARGLGDRDSAVRSTAARTMGKMRCGAAAEALLGALHDGDKWVRRDAAESLGKIGDRRAIGPLKRLLEDSHMAPRLAAAASLVELGEPFPLDWVTPIIRSKETNEFQSAIWLVRRHARRHAVPTLIRCLDMNDPSASSYYNYTLVWQVGACGGPKLTYHHDFESRGTEQQIRENRKTLNVLKAWLKSHPGK